MNRTLWGQQFDTCWVCGRRENSYDGVPLDTHEIPRGPHRAKAVTEPAAWLRVCRECHDHGLGTIAEQLALKKANDHENYDRVKVNRLRGRADDAVTEAEVDAAMEILA